jgi:two-component system, response regulator / RNA-binding antiterminator
VQSILDVCISRFNAMARVQDELEKTKSALEERKVIDRAKGILMRTKGITEEDAYRLLRTAAMNGKKKIAEIARSIVTAAEHLR